MFAFAKQLEAGKWNDPAQLETRRRGHVDAEAHGARRAVSSRSDQVTHRFVPGAIRVTEVLHRHTKTIFQRLLAAGDFLASLR